MDAILAFKSGEKIFKMGERLDISANCVELVGEWQGIKRARYRRINVGGEFIGDGWIDEQTDKSIGGLTAARMEAPYDELRAPTNVFLFIGYDKRMFEIRYEKMYGWVEKPAER